MQNQQEKNCKQDRKTNKKIINKYQQLQIGGKNYSQQPQDVLMFKIF